MNIRPIQLKKVAQYGAVLAIAIAIGAMTVSDAFAQRGRGGGGRGGGGARGGSYGGGGGGYGGASRAPSSYNRSPSMSRPSTPSRPSTSSMNRGGASSANRGGAGTANRGGAGTANRGGAGTANRGGATNRSAATGRGARDANPSKNQLNSFLNSPSQGAAGAAGRPAAGNSAVNDFFSHNSAGANHNAAATHQNASNRQAGSAANQRADNISNRGETRSNARDSRGENRDFASDNRQDRVSNRGDSQAVRVSDRAETRSSLAEGRGENRSERQQQRGEHADHIRDQLEQEFDDNHLFDDFWKNNPEAYYRFNQNPAFWTWATAATVGSFFGAGYSSGGGEAYYDDGAVYTDAGQVPAEQYAEQAEEIVESAPEVENPDDMEWLPLGVFALSENSKSDATPNLFLQLAVSKEGIVAGTLNNKTTDDTQSVEGMLDQKSGRAAWTIAGKSTPIMETKLEGLTENETNMLVHFEDGTTQEWLMLHMENPEGEE